MVSENISFSQEDKPVEQVTIGNLSEVILSPESPPKTGELNLPLDCFFKSLNSFDMYGLSIPLSEIMKESDVQNDTVSTEISWKMAIGLRNTHFYDERRSNNESSSKMRTYYRLGLGIPVVLIVLFSALYAWKRLK